MKRRGLHFGGVLLNPVDEFPPCTCDVGGLNPTVARFGFSNLPSKEVHIAGCATLKSKRSEPSPAKPAKPAKIIIPGQAQTPLRVTPKRRKRDRQAPSNYKLVLQFFFQRPINIDLWKKIKAPRGWRKCPTGKEAQSKYYGVRFQCRDLKYALAPDELEELRARLYMCLEQVF